MVLLKAVASWGDKNYDISFTVCYPNYLSVFMALNIVQLIKNTIKLSMNVIE